MPSAAGTFFRHVLTQKPDLWQAILRFNLCGTPWQEKASLPPPELLHTAELDAQAVQRLWQEPTLRRRWHHASPSACSLRADAFWDFAEESRRLALLEADTSTRLALVLGVAIHAESLMRTVRKEELLPLYQDPGKELLHYALHRGRFQLAAATRFFEGRDPTWPLARRIREHGLQSLLSLRAHWPQALRARQPSSSPTQALPLDTTDHAALWQDVKKILLKEVAPSWTPCFD